VSREAQTELGCLPIDAGSLGHAVGGRTRGMVHGRHGRILTNMCRAME
jgi:hypothetical protein